MSQSNDKPPSLDALQRKIDAITPESNKDSANNSDAQQSGKAMTLATELLAGVGVGGVLGYFIDKALGTLPIFFILFFFLGFAAGLRNLMRRFNEVDK